MARVSRLRQLTPAQALRLEWLRRMARLLDSAVEVPGTRWRVGLDPVLGLVPGVGDLVSLVLGLAIVWQARDLGVPRIVQLRMILNAGIDAVLGSVPVIGDLFDVAWHSNTMNLALLERHAYEERAGTAPDWLVVLSMLFLVVLAIALPVLALLWTVRVVAGMW